MQKLKSNKQIFFFLFQFFFFSTNFSQIPIYGEGVFDIEGHNYTTIILENGQEWMAENLKTTRFSNGDSIPHKVENMSWQNSLSAAYSYYNEETELQSIYGNIYNWYVTIDERNVCPIAWHVPTDNEWTNFTDLFGGNGAAGGKMKVQDTLFWKSPNLGATNECLFSGLPAGCRYDGGNFANNEKYAYWWSSTQLDNQLSWFRSASYVSDNLIKNYATKETGYSIRCIKNQPLIIDENQTNLGFTISPNPFTENITIKTKEIGKTLLIQNINGETIETILLDSAVEVFALEYLSEGIYFIIDSSTMSRFKIIKL